MSDLILEQSPETAENQSHITFEEFLKRYDGQHAEWLMGEVIVQVSNNLTHQNLLIFLLNLLSGYLSLKPVGKLLLAGFIMYIAEDVPAREPDLLIVLNENNERIKQTYLDGPADIAVEVVSPESVKRDHGDKFAEYEAAGVKEYWLFDPIRELADIYILNANGVYVRHPLDNDGKLTSTLLPGFALDPAILWSDEFPQGLALLKLVSAMTGVPLA